MAKEAKEKGEKAESPSKEAKEDFMEAKMKGRKMARKGGRGSCRK